MSLVSTLGTCHGLREETEVEGMAWEVGATSEGGWGHVITFSGACAAEIDKEGGWLKVWPL